MMIGPEIRVRMIKKVDYGSRLVKWPRSPGLALGIVDRYNLPGLPTVFSLQILASQYGGNNAVKARKMKINGEIFRHGCT
jgi:hypothetical protein